MKKGLCVLIVMLCIAALGVYAGGSQEQQASKATTKIKLPAGRNPRTELHAADPSA